MAEIPDPTEQITILTCAEGHTLAKHFDENGKLARDYDAGYHFRVSRVPIPNLRALWELLPALACDETACVVRGEVHPEVDLFTGSFGSGEWVRRLCTVPKDEPDITPAFSPYACTWLAIDIDDSTVPFDLEDPAGSAQTWYETEAPRLGLGGCIWQYSTKAHTRNTMRGRAWVWLARGHTDYELRRWAVSVGADPALYNPVQPHFTADPKFADGWGNGGDPLAGQRWHLLGDPDALSILTIPEGSAEAPARLLTAGNAAPATHDDPRVQRMLAAAPNAGDCLGLKWGLVGAFGGLCRRQGVPRAVCEGFLRAWLEGHAEDVEEGVERGLGAYQRPAAKVSGLAELAAIIGHEAADRWQCASARALASVTRAERRREATPDPLANVDPSAEVEGAGEADLEYIDLDSTKQGPKPTIDNAVRILRHAFDGTLRYETCRGRVICAGIDGLDAEFPDGEWTDVHTTNFVQVCERAGVRIAAGQADRAVESFAAENSFNALSDWVSSREWDGELRIPYVLERYFGAEPSDYTRAVSTRFMLSLVARAMRPGEKVDTVLILEGEQGKRKSSALRALVGTEWFADSDLPIGDKDGAQAIRGKWLWEFPELDSFKRASEITRIKAYLSRQWDTFRPSFGRHTIDVPRQTVFCGSTNETRYLKDETGNRRFWPVACGALDAEGLEAVRDVLFGEAYAAWAEGEAALAETGARPAECQWWLTPEEEALAVAVRGERLVALDDPWIDVLRKWLETRAKPAPAAPAGETAAAKRFATPRPSDETFTTLDALGAVGVPADRMDRGNALRVSICLHHLGWERASGAGARAIWRRVG